MFFLLLSFFAGVLSVFAACVLPLLPVIVGGSLMTGGSRRRMYVIVGALALSIVAFTLLLKASTALIGIPESFWRYLSGGIIAALGIFILFPKLWAKVPGVNALNRSSNQLLSAGYQKGGFWGDALMGVALGPVFASCSPTYFIILATVLPAQPLLGFTYLVAYAIGLSLALLLIAILGEKLVARLGVTLDPEGKFYRGIGALLLIVGVLVLTGWMRNIETWFVERGFDATFIELRLLGANESEKPANAGNTFMSAEMKAGVYPKAPELAGIEGYINTEGKPITLSELIGKKVVLIDFWTYSCINCQRTLPYLRAWYDAYAEQGLEIVGVHTPEFAFEQVPANVSNAVADFELRYPVVLDNTYSTWRAYGNNYWPRKYLIDIDGYIVYDHIGEGGYDETEEAIRRALLERAERLGTGEVPMPEAKPEGVVEVERGGVQSPEVYFGAMRNEFLGNSADTGGNFTVPTSPRLNTLYFGGKWQIEPEYAENLATSASIVFRYNAKNVYFVASADEPVTVRIYRDGELLTTERGLAVDENGQATIQADRLYHLIEGGDYGEHVLEIRIEGKGLKAYTFTFG